jgi:putative transposase
MEKFKNKYRILSHRRPNWDYSADALCFLTIVTQNMECNLGKIVNNEMILSDFGKIVEREWFKSFEIRNELILHAFVLMPNDGQAPRVDLF